MCGCWEMQGRAQARLLLSLDVHTELRYMVFNPLPQANCYQHYCYTSSCHKITKETVSAGACATCLPCQWTIMEWCYTAYHYCKLTILSSLFLLFCVIRHTLWQLARTAMESFEAHSTALMQPLPPPTLQHLDSVMQSSGLWRDCRLGRMTELMHTYNGSVQVVQPAQTIFNVTHDSCLRFCSTVRAPACSTVLV
jgi:hypothetical protein